MTGSEGSFALRPTSGVSTDCGGRRLIGGSPLRMMTLTDAGAELVAGWFDGKPVAPEPAHQALARRLVEADMATPVADRPGPDTANLVVVIPVKDDAEGLTKTLTALAPRVGVERHAGSDTGIGPVRRVVIVDDGSEPAVDRVIDADVDVPLTVLRRSDSAGPGIARNLGVRDEEAEIVVFVDAGVVVTPDQLVALAAELYLGDTVAIAPRIRSEVCDSRLGRYERRWSPLDLGPDAGLVGPGRRISYVPSTCLALRMTALTASGGFDPDLRFGEDVDLVWRLGARGWVRYVPTIQVTHPPRSTLGGLVRQRFRYGTSAGPLARRHGPKVAPARLDSRSAATWAALLTGFRRPAALVAGTATAVHTAHLIRRGMPVSLAATTVVRGWVGTARGLALAVARTWWPLAVVAATRPRFRPASLLLVGGWLRRARRRPSGVADTCSDVALGVLDDSAYAIGVWTGAVRERTLLPLLPHIPFGRDATGR